MRSLDPRTVMLVLLAAGAAAVGPPDALALDAAAVVALVQAADARDDNALVQRAAQRTAAAPADAAAVTATAVHLAPWLAEAVVGVVLDSLSPQQRRRHTPAVLVAALVSTRGQMASALLAEARAAAPEADAAVLALIAKHLAAARAGPVPGAFAVPELASVPGLPPMVRAALMQAVLEGHRAAVTAVAEVRAVDLGLVAGRELRTEAGTGAPLPAPPPDLPTLVPQGADTAAMLPVDARPPPEWLFGVSPYADPWAGPGGLP